MDPFTPIQTVIQQLTSMVKATIQALPNILIAIVVFVIFWFIAKFSKRLIRNFTKGKQSRNLGLILARLSRGLIILIGAFVALAIVVPTFKPGDLVELLDVSGVDIGFAFRDILQNLLAGILILITEPFVINDRIILGVLRSNPEAILDPPPEALVVGLAESTVNIRARWWVDPPRRAEVLDSQDWVLTELCNKLVMAGIDRADKRIVMFGYPARA